MDHIVCTNAMNGNYVLLFGSGTPIDCFSKRELYFKDIYVYSVKNQTILQSQISFPNRTFDGITIIKDEQLVYGYVRNEWTRCNLPNDLLKIIRSYYGLYEFVHLQDISGGSYYKI
eukprot:468642_1